MQSPSSPPSRPPPEDRDVYYSDIRLVWLGRGIDQHLFPYTGSITPDGLLTGGTDGGTAKFLVQLGVWSQAARLVLLFVLFVRAPLRRRRAGGTSAPGAPRRGDLVVH